MFTIKGGFTTKNKEEASKKLKEVIFRGKNGDN